MADTNTTHLSLIKQDPTAAPDVAKSNSNLDTLDSEIWARGKKFNDIPVSLDGEFHVRSVPYAENLDTSASQTSDDEYIIRATGGSASLSDGDAWLTSIVGRYKRVGYSAPSITITVTEVSDPDHLEVTYNEADFISKNPASTEYTLVYTSTWVVNSVEVDPYADYGITISGTPVTGDSIYVSYSAEVLGTIVHSNPSAFVSTGWNLYDHANARAHVIRYSEESIIKITGAYTQVTFAPDLTTSAASRISITPTTTGDNAIISIPQGYDEGYFFVTGGDSTTTAVWMTWTDWVNGYKWDSTTQQQGEFQAYSETQIGLAQFISTNFPNGGLLSTGNVSDEINFTTKVAYSRVERIAYSAQALEQVIASGLNYVYDGTYIYAERLTPIQYAVPDSITNGYTANDHGLEMFTGTSVSLIASTAYGANLRNKLERDVLTISQQSLTLAQREQVRKNIDAPDVFKLGFIGIENSSSSVTVRTATNTNLGTLVLAKGTYILQCVASFSANSTGKRMVFLSDTSGGSLTNRYAIGSTNAVSNGATRVGFTTMMEVSAARTFYITAYQDSGSTLTVDGIGVMKMQIK